MTSINGKSKQRYLVPAFAVGCAAVLASTALSGVAAADSSADGSAVVLTNQERVAQIQTRIAASERVIIGYSVKGRPIVARRYGPADGSRVFVAVGSMHGTEPAGGSIINRLAKLGNARGTTMWLIKTLNPDGLAAHTRANAHGVDLNRNSPDVWHARSRNDNLYWPGPYAASEPETRAYMDFFSAVKPDLVLSYHQAAYGVDSYHAKNMKVVRDLATRMQMPVKNFNCDGECTGTLTGWNNNILTGIAITVELPGGSLSPTTAIRYAIAARSTARRAPDVVTVG